MWRTLLQGALELLQIERGGHRHGMARHRRRPLTVLRGRSCSRSCLPGRVSSNLGVSKGWVRSAQSPSEQTRRALSFDPTDRGERYAAVRDFEVDGWRWRERAAVRSRRGGLEGFLPYCVYLKNIWLQAWLKKKTLWTREVVVVQEGFHNRGAQASRVRSKLSWTVVNVRKRVRQPEARTHCSKGGKGDRHLYRMA
ncbi:hypothetical protein B0H34DRAFT_60982 [Crassisporium funariophilum]|nr:hypothetical protein B0H34DRAFT_60982 [Crassisporium funariophilum]